MLYVTIQIIANLICMSLTSKVARPHTKNLISSGKANHSGAMIMIISIFCGLNTEWEVNTPS